MYENDIYFGHIECTLFNSYFESATDRRKRIIEKLSI